MEGSAPTILETDASTSDWFFERSWTAVCRESCKPARHPAMGNTGEAEEWISCTAIKTLRLGQEISQPTSSRRHGITSRCQTIRSGNPPIRSVRRKHRPTADMKRPYAGVGTTRKLAARVPAGSDKTHATVMGFRQRCLESDQSDPHHIQNASHKRLKNPASGISAFAISGASATT